MTIQENCVYIYSQVACALIECEAMKAANRLHVCSDLAPLPPYDEAAFLALIEKYGIHHNAVIGSIQSSYR